MRFRFVSDYSFRYKGSQIAFDAPLGARPLLRQVQPFSAAPSGLIQLAASRTLYQCGRHIFFSCVRETSFNLRISESG